MRTLLIATLLCVAVAQTYAAYSCYGSTCAGLNAACTPNADTGIYPTCNFGLYCDGSVCKSKVALGGDCTGTNAACVEGAECAEGVCIAYRNYPGEACSQNSQCRQFADNGTEIASTCVNGKCAAIANGQPCADSAFFDQCGATSICSGSPSVCTAIPTAGQACTGNCVDGSSCISGTCVSYYSIAQGGACVDGQYCAAGLVCGSITEKCIAATSQRTGIKCDVTNTSTCLDSEDCGCGGVASEDNTCQAKKGVSSAQINAERAYDSCKVNDFACSNNWDSCSACDTQVCALYNLDNSIASTCFAGPRAKDLPNTCKATSSASTVAISAVVGVAAVIALF